MVKTKLSRANTNGPSLRTTIPQAVVEAMGLSDGDEIDWLIKNANGSLIAMIRKS